MGGRTKDRGPTLGKAFKLARGDVRPGLLLEVGGVMVLVGWDDGLPRVNGPAQRRGYAAEPDVQTLCADWGLTLAELDAAVEWLIYKGHPDVVKVRSMPGRRV